MSERTPPLSRTATELAQLEERRAVLIARKAEEDAARATASEHLRALAVKAHARSCPDNHPTLQCTWYLEGEADEPAAADWTGARHRYWLGVVAGLVADQRDLLWTVTEPTEPGGTR